MLVVKWMERIDGVEIHDGTKMEEKPTLVAVLNTCWQRCRVHFMRNALAHVPKQQHQMGAAVIGTAFVKDDRGRLEFNMAKVYQKQDEMTKKRNSSKTNRQHDSGTEQPIHLYEYPVSSDHFYVPA